MEMRILTAKNQLPAAVDHMNSSNSSTPYMSAASSPRRPRSQLDFFFYSAPTSPRSYNHSMSTADVLYDDYSAEDVALLKHDHSAAVPFDWELKPGVAKEGDDQKQKKQQVLENENEKEEFEFDFSGQLDRMVRPSLSSADELFDGGKIRPLKLKPPPSLQISNNNNDSRISSENHSPRSPKSAMSKFKDALSVSPRHRRKGSDEDPFEAAIRSSRKLDSAAASAVNDDDSVHNRGRGRSKFNTTTANTNTNKRGSNNNRKGISRSLSPLRVSEFALLHHQQLQEHQNNPNENNSNNSTRFLGRGTNTNSKKWRLKDLFLFRSASEGHYKDTQSFSKRWSARSSSTVNSGSVSESGSVSKRRGQAASAHEMHYTTNKAVSEEMKKKTSLPYKHGLLACLGFSPILPQFSYTFPSSSSTTLS